MRSVKIVNFREEFSQSLACPEEAKGEFRLYHERMSVRARKSNCDEANSSDAGPRFSKAGPGSSDFWIVTIFLDF